MYILALETTGPLGSVALINEYGKVLCKTSQETMSHLKDLMPMATSVLETAGVNKKDLTAVAASIGPGSFTGIRIGVSSARAMAQALTLPCVSVPTLDCFRPVGSAKEEAASGISPGAQNPDSAGYDLIAPIFNARRNQVYGALFDSQGNDILKPGPYMLNDVLEAISKYADEKCDEVAPTTCDANPLSTMGKLPHNIAVKFYGDGIDAYQAKIEEYFEGSDSSKPQDSNLGQSIAKQLGQNISKELGQNIAKELGGNVRIDFAEKSQRYQSAAQVAEIALRKFQAGQTCHYNELLPDYMRVTEAEQKLADGTLSAKRNSVCIK